MWPMSATPSPARWESAPTRPRPVPARVAPPGYEWESYRLDNRGRNVTLRGSLVLTISMIERE